MRKGLVMTVVRDKDLQPEHTVCPLCGAAGPRRSEVVLQVSPRVELALCSRCGGSSATRFPNDAFLEALYDPSHYTSDLLAQRRLTARFGRHLAHFVPPEATRILDYGGNDGGLSHALDDALRAAGHPHSVEFTVVDLHTRSTEGPVRFATVDAFLADAKHYDVVLASAVLEHLPDFKTIAGNLLAAVEPGGIFYGRTPYEVALHRWVPGYAVRWPRHLHDLGPRFWARFLDVFGYRGDMLRSAPSPVESELRTKPLRTLAATLLKAPSQLEVRLRGDAVGERGPWWRWVGGWEAIFRVHGRNPNERMR